MGKHEVVVNEKLCVGCGLCVKDCVAGAIHIEDGKAKVGVGCIACGHCEAICPNAAVELTGFQEESIPFAQQTRLDPGQLMEAMATRRTIRQFQNRPVFRDVEDQIINAGRLAPTGGNAQNTGYIILSSSKSTAEALAVGFFRKMLSTAKPVIPFLKNMEIDDHFFFKGAPLVIVVTGSTVNASLAAQNMAFMAEANGLGVLFSGFFTMCANNSRKIRKLLGMKRGEKAVTTLVMGYPAVRYHRTAKREAARVRKV